MKVQIKGSLNAGVHLFINERCFNGRLIVQQKPIKNWGDWANNELYTTKIVPTLTALENEAVETYYKNHPYLLYRNNQLYSYAKSWKEALHLSNYYLEYVTTPLGFAPLELEKQFLKNEPTITFSEIHKILEKAGVVFE